MNVSLIYYYLLFVVWALHGCGGGGSGSSSSNPPPDSLEGAFLTAGQTNQIPTDYLKAVAYLESNMAAQRAYVPYVQTQGHAVKRFIGSPLMETAFGISRATLGLKNEDPESDSLNVQVAAYAKWVKDQLEAKQLALPAFPREGKDIYNWIWELAKLHRRGEENQHNVRVIWALELIHILNTGFVWQSQDSRELLRLNPADPQISLTSFPPEAQTLLRIQDFSSDVSPNARRFELTNALNTLHQKPAKIAVIHCPLSLSACLELQDPNLSSELRLGAHMIIPQDDTVYPRALEIIDYDRRVQMTNLDGVVTDLKDTYVIMLVGNSGRYVDGIRLNANPTWFTPWQLRRLGAVVRSVCRFLTNTYAGFDESACTSVGGEKGVQFYEQGIRPTYRWGDIADFDKAIFLEYVNSGNVAGSVVMEFNKKDKIYQGGQDFSVKARFQQGVRYVRLQRAVRCSDEQIVWETVHAEGVKNEVEREFKLSFWDAGPNHNGQQFLRVLTFGDKNQLTGWAIDAVYISEFDKDYNPPSESCFLHQN